MWVISTDISHIRNYCEHSFNLVGPNNKSQGPQGIYRPQLENHLSRDTVGFPEISLRIYKCCIFLFMIEYVRINIPWVFRRAISNFDIPHIGKSDWRGHGSTGRLNWQELGHGDQGHINARDGIYYVEPNLVAVKMFENSLKKMKINSISKSTNLMELNAHFGYQLCCNVPLPTYNQITNGVNKNYLTKTGTQGQRFGSYWVPILLK